MTERFDGEGRPVERCEAVTVRGDLCTYHARHQVATSYGTVPLCGSHAKLLRTRGWLNIGYRALLEENEDAS